AYLIAAAGALAVVAVAVVLILSRGGDDHKLADTDAAVDAPTGTATPRATATSIVEDTATATPTSAVDQGGGDDTGTDPAADTKTFSRTTYSVTLPADWRAGARDVDHGAYVE